MAVVKFYNDYFKEAFNDSGRFNEGVPDDKKEIISQILNVFKGKVGGKNDNMTMLVKQGTMDLFVSEFLAKAGDDPDDYSLCFYMKNYAENVQEVTFSDEEYEDAATKKSLPYLTIYQSLIDGKHTMAQLYALVENLMYFYAEDVRRIDGELNVNSLDIDQLAERYLQACLYVLKSGEYILENENFGKIVMEFVLNGKKSKPFSNILHDVDIYKETVFFTKAKDVCNTVTAADSALYKLATQRINGGKMVLIEESEVYNDVRKILRQNYKINYIPEYRDAPDVYIQGMIQSGGKLGPVPKERIAELIGTSELSEQVKQALGFAK